MKILSNKEIQMIDGMKNRDEHSFNIFYETKYNFLYFVVLKIVKNKQDAEEVTQDACLKIYEKIDTFSGENFNGWIYSIARNLAINFYNRVTKKNQKLIHNEDILEKLEDKDTSISPLYSQLRQHFSDETTDIIIYHAVFDFSFQHIADMLELNKSFVFRNYKSSLPKLKLLLEGKI